MKIAILGTGLMGSAMAEALIGAGHQVIVYNRTAARTAPLVALGASAAVTPAEAIMAAEATILVPLGAKGASELLIGAKAALAGKKLINAATTSVGEIVAIADGVARHGGALAEMTSQVGHEQLRERQGNFAIGCRAADEQFWTGILLSVGAAVTRVGEVGDATKAEASALVASMFMTVSAAHAVAIIRKMNMPLDVDDPLLKMSLSGAEYLLPQLASRNYDQIFASVDSYISGLNIAIQNAESVGMPTRILEDMLKLFESAARRGYGQKDGCAILEVLLDSQGGDN